MIEYYIYLAGCLSLVFISFLVFAIISELCRSTHAQWQEEAKAERLKEREKESAKFRKAS